MSARTARAREVDWQELRRRLAKIAAAGDEATELSADCARAVMDQRARALARSAAPLPQPGERIELVTVALANERYGIEARFVREVARLTGLTPVPGLPDFLVGLTSLRGEILLIVDIRKFFSVASRGLTDLSRLVVLGTERVEFGVLVDQVYEVTTVAVADLRDPPEFVTGIDRAYLRGVTSEALVVLDAARLLEDSRIFVDHGRETNA